MNQVCLPVSADGAPGAKTGPPERIAEAWLVAIKDSEPLSDFDRLTLHQAVTIVALELLRGRVAGDTERRLAGDVLAAMVDGALGGVELARRLAPFGVSDQVAAIVVSRPADGHANPRPVEDALSGALREEAWQRWLDWDPVRMVPKYAEQLRSLRGIWIDAGTRDEWFLDLGAQAFRAALDQAGVGGETIAFELFDASHMAIDYRYPMSLAWMCQRMAG